MKKYILPSNVNWYRANMHCHSNISDGSFTPDKIKKVYKEMGYSIVAFTDHDILLDHSYLNDDSFLAITSSEYTVYADGTYYPKLYNGEFENEQAKIDDDWRRSKVMHLNIYSKDPHNEFQVAADEYSLWPQRGKWRNTGKCDGYHRSFSAESINEAIRRLNKAGFFVQLNHPNWSLNEHDDYINLKGLWSVEIFNYANERLTGAEYCPYIYDDMVRNGMYNLKCTMGDDNHNSGGETELCFGGSTFFGATELTYDNIIECMENGNFYCASGKNPPQIKALYVEDNIIKVDCSSATDVFITGYSRRFRHVSGEGITHAEFRLRPEDVFFRITVRDKYGNNAHTNYYNVKDFYEEINK